MSTAIRNQYNEDINSTQPLPVALQGEQQVVSISETITYNGKAAAGAITINAAERKAIMSVEGDQVASYWGEDKNKVYKALVDGVAPSGGPRLLSVTETAGSAAFVVVDASKDLELLFESLTTTVKRFVARVTDTTGATLYGWIMGVAASGDTYTFSVYNARVAETNNWVGTLADFTHTSLKKVEIFRYNSSLVFGTNTTLTEEVMCPKEFSSAWDNPLAYASETLTNGQYFVDYLRGRIIGKKADTTASETITYNVGASTGVQSYDYRTVRSSLVLTNSYVAGTVLTGLKNFNQLVIEVDFTIGSLTSMELKVEFLNGAVYSQETFSSLSGSTSTDTLGEHTMTATGIYNIPIPIKCSGVRISVKGTGTVTSSLCAINAVVGVA